MCIKTVDDEQDLKLAFILFYLNKIAQRYTADMISVACNPGMPHAKCFKGDRFFLQQHQSYLSPLIKMLDKFQCILLNNRKFKNLRITSDIN